MRVDYSTIPGYLEAVHAEQVLRSFAFLPLTEFIGPFEVIQINLRRWGLLRLMGNPLIVGGTPSPAQLSQFLWVLSPKFNPKARGRWRHNMRFWHFTRKPRSDAMLIGMARKYLADAFHDFEGKAKGLGYIKSYFSDESYFVALLGRYTNCTADETLDMPIRRLLQYTKAIRFLNDPKCLIGNPSEKLISDWLEDRSGNKA